MSQSQVGRDGQFRMVIEERYKKIGGVRREAKFFAILAGTYGIVKLVLTLLPALLDGQPVDQLYMATVFGSALAFILYNIASGGGRPHKEIKPLLWLYVPIAAGLGTKALMEVWFNPVVRRLLHTGRHIRAPYDPTLARLLVTYLKTPAGTAATDVDAVNLVLSGIGAFGLLVAAAANVKYLQLKGQAAKVKPGDKKAA